MREPPAASTPPPAWILALTGVVTVLAFVPTLGGGFLGDDFVYVSRFHDFPWSSWARLFTREWSEGIWGFQLSELRPFSALSFMIDGRLYGGETLGYRVTNLIFHLSVVLAVSLLAWRYSRGNKGCALVAGLLFALHPAHLEPVSWITGRVDVLSTACALWFWVAGESWADSGRIRPLVLSIAVLFVGVFAKELCLFAPPLLFLRWLLVDARVERTIWIRRGVILLGVVAIALIYNACRHAAFGINATVPGSTWHNTAAWQRQMSYLGWLAPILPFQGHAEFPASGNPETLRWIGTLVAFVVVTGLLVSAWRGWHRFGQALFFTGGWWLVTVGGLLLVGYFSPRHLYFPTAGLAIGAGLVVSSLAARSRVVVSLALLVWIGAGHVYALKPWIQNGRISRDLIATAQADAAQAAPGSAALVVMPGVRGLAWLWSWALPHALGKPFLSTPFAAKNVLTDAASYYRPESWEADFRYVQVFSTAPGAVVLSLSDDGRVRHRVLSGEELQAESKRLKAGADGKISPNDWAVWIHSVLPN